MSYNTSALDASASTQTPEKWTTDHGGTYVYCKQYTRAQFSSRHTVELFTRYLAAYGYKIIGLHTAGAVVQIDYVANAASCKLRMGV